MVLHLKFTGAHFVLPIDKVEESYESDKVEELARRLEVLQGWSLPRRGGAAAGSTG